ncbi:HtaA domain-containing protein, partial [Streptomyces sp. NPDC089919]|uniref:HtaA domain-containing protein n=1 Tax=Streptomyces sp. NPDC089919 TaxID=3155188 RepID=UPI00343FAB96
MPVSTTPATPVGTPRRRRRTAAVTGAIATALALGAVGALPGPAAAAETPVKDYDLTWGVKDSWRSYVTGMAAGSFTASGGATQAKGNGPFTFSGGAGTYDTNSHALKLAFKGTVRAVSAAHAFDIKITDVTFRYDGAKGTITADVTKNGAAQNDVPLATVAVSRSMKDMATTLTKQAADALGSPGYAGAAGSPLTVAPHGATPQPSTSPSTRPTTGPTPSPTAGTPRPTPSASQRPAAKGRILDGTLGWGVKKSFRDYVKNGPAAGRITVSGGAKQASDNGPFTFVKGAGRYDTGADTVSARFKGTVRFRGHRSGSTYGLDLALTDLTVTLQRGKGTLTADVTSLGKRSEDVQLATLKAASPSVVVSRGRISLPGVKATLTKAGAAAFGGFYPAGTALDPAGLGLSLTSGSTGGTSGGTSGGADGGTDGGGSAGGAAASGGSAGGATTGGAGTTGSTTGGASGALAVAGDLAATGSTVPVG